VTQITDVDALLAVIDRRHATDDGEGLSMLAHHLQTAAQLAIDAPDDVELQVAGLVHDIGTILEPETPLTHARTGGDAVRPLLGPRVAELVTQHDQAKRYLVTAEPEYAGVLSAQSVATLEIQGGTMDATTRAAFEQHPEFEACLALRRADDAAKVPDKAVPALSSWRAALDACTVFVRPR
jgi:predicted HD phosphohydrolase